jgi:hypothetical protein
VQGGDLVTETKTRRFGLMSLIAVCIIAPAGVAVMRAMNEPHTLPKVASDKELVTFLVTFDPSPREKVVIIELMPGNDPMSAHTELASPFVRERMLPPGAPVGLKVFSNEPGTTTCKIRQGLKVLVTDTREGRGPLVCKAMVT